MITLAMAKDLFKNKFMNMVNTAKSIIKMDEDGTKGYLREYFLHEVLEEMLPVHIGAGSGIIVKPIKKDSGVNPESSQCDVIIYDKRILPPFIANTKISVYPIQSVIGIIEVKTGINDKPTWDKICNKMKEINDFFHEFEDEIGGINEHGIPYTERRRYDLLLLVFSYNMTKDDEDTKPDWSELRTKKTADELLPEFMSGYCIVGAGSFFHLRENTKFVPEAKANALERFLCISLDNIIRYAADRYEQVSFQTPRKATQTDTWSQYIR